jgi:hypothetical protein
MVSSCVIACSSNPAMANPRDSFNTLPKTGGNVTEGHLQNAKPIQMIPLSVIDLNARARFYIPNWTRVEKTMAAVIQMLLPLTVGG